MPHLWENASGRSTQYSLCWSPCAASGKPPTTPFDTSAATGTNHTIREELVVDIRHQCVLVSNVDTMTRRQAPNLLQGTLDLLILRTLQSEPEHGWAISERIQQISEDALQVNQGSLYPALHRLEHRGWIESEWGVSELGRRARFYKLTAPGRRRLALEADEWERMTTAIGRVLKLA